MLMIVQSKVVDVCIYIYINVYVYILYDVTLLVDRLNYGYINDRSQYIDVPLYKYILV